MPRIDYAEMEARYLAGATIAELAAAYGMSQETIRRRMIEAGIPIRKRGPVAGKYRPAGGRVVDRDGYTLVRAQGHPQATGGYVREHRLVAEAQLGRPLTAGEVVAHRNGQRGDNRPENLRVYESASAHASATLAGNSHALGDKGNPKRGRRHHRTPGELLDALAWLHESLGRDIQRSDLVPPHPSYAVLNRKFGSWREAVRQALSRES
jgi:hypothetical protein